MRKMDNSKHPDLLSLVQPQTGEWTKRFAHTENTDGRRAETLRGNVFTVTLFSFGGVELLGGELTACPAGTRGTPPGGLRREVFTLMEASAGAKGEEILCSNKVLTHRHQHHSNSPKVFELRGEMNKWEASHTAGRTRGVHVLLNCMKIRKQHFKQ